MDVGRVGEYVTLMLRGCYEETAVVEFRLNGDSRRVLIAQQLVRYIYQCNATFSLYVTLLRPISHQNLPHLIHSFFDSPDTPPPNGR